MSENHSIHEFDVNLIVEYFSKIERQGPGSPEITLKALSFIEHLSANAQAADLGCGTGGQTMVLACLLHREKDMTLEDLGYDPSLDTYRKEKQKEYNSEKNDKAFGKMLKNYKKNLFKYNNLLVV